MEIAFPSKICFAGLDAFEFRIYFQMIACANNRIRRSPAEMAEDTGIPQEFIESIFHNLCKYNEILGMHLVTKNSQTEYTINNNRSLYSKIPENSHIWGDMTIDQG